MQRVVTEGSHRTHCHFALASHQRSKATDQVVAPLLPTRHLTRYVGNKNLPTLPSPSPHAFIGKTQTLGIAQHHFQGLSTTCLYRLLQRHLFVERVRHRESTVQSPPVPR